MYCSGINQKLDFLSPVRLSRFFDGDDLMRESHKGILRALMEMLDTERIEAAQRLCQRLGDQIFLRDRSRRREGLWSIYLVWLVNEIGRSAEEAAEARSERRVALNYLDKQYRRSVTCDDLVHLAREAGCDLFDVVLLMPTIVGDLVELRMG
jgi:hypothetical protein